MCSAAHGLVGLGPIVYIHSSAQLVEWRQAFDLPQPRVTPLPIQEVAPGVPVEGPMAGLDDRMHLLHTKYLRGLLARREPPMSAAAPSAAALTSGAAPPPGRR